MFKGSGILRASFMSILLILAVLFASVLHAAAQVRLTGLTGFDTDSAGNIVLPNVWDTRTGGLADIFVINGPLGGPLINGGTDRSINVSLLPGDYLFTLHLNGGSVRPYYGLNLFFNGENGTPRISVFAAGNDSPTGPCPPFMPDAGTTEADDHDGRVPGAGTLSETIGGDTVTLTDICWSNPDVFHQDRVGSLTVGPDGFIEHIAQFRLRVGPAPVPEPTFYQMGTLLVCGAGYAFLRRCRR